MLPRHVRPSEGKEENSLLIGFIGTRSENLKPQSAGLPDRRAVGLLRRYQADEKKRIYGKYLLPTPILGHGS
jgi:hypothetical protein